MRAQINRPRVQNGPIAKRRNRPVARPAKRVSERKSGRKGNELAETQHGSKVLWALMCIGAIVAAGFIYALRSQNAIHQLGQAEAQLKAELDEIADHQRYEALERQRALSPRQIDLSVKHAGLIQPRFNQLPAASPVRPASSSAQAVTVAKARPQMKMNQRVLPGAGVRGRRDSQPARQIARAQKIR